MKSRLLRTCVTGLAVAVLPLAVQAPAAAKDDSEKKPKKDAAPTETGCLDITDGVASYTRDRDANNVALNSGQAQLTVLLAAPSCPEATYTLTVYGADQQVLATATRVGDGVTGPGEDPFVLTAAVNDYADSCLALQATTSVDGQVVDTAPDAITSYRAVCDGGSPGLTYR